MADGGREDGTNGRMLADGAERGRLRKVKGACSAARIFLRLINDRLWCFVCLFCVLVGV